MRAPRGRSPGWSEYDAGELVVVRRVRHPAVLP